MLPISVHREVLLGSLRTVVGMQVEPFSVRPAKAFEGLEALNFLLGIYEVYMIILFFGDWVGIFFRLGLSMQFAELEFSVK